MYRFKGNNRHVYAGFLLAAPAAMLLAAGNAHAYCSSNGSNSGYEWMDSVSLAGYSHPSGNNGGYADFTHQVFDLSTGANALTLTPGFYSTTYNEYWKIWIDFNQDSTFTEDESVFSGASSSAINGSITIPETAPSVSTRMRVSMKYGSSPQPCGSFTYGEVEDYTVNLDTTDLTSPTVSSTSPGAAAVDISINSVITINFSEDIDPLSFNSDSITLSSGGINIPGTASLNGSVATFSPNQPLEHSTEYVVTVLSGLLDLANNPLLQDESWSFTTAAPDIIAPSVSQTSPADGATDVDRNAVISVLFSEPMNPANINASTFTVSDGIQNIAGTVAADGNSAQFYPAQELNYLTSYTATLLGQIEDLAGNSMGSNHSWSFTSRAFEPTYCPSSANNTNYMWISGVKVGGYTHSSPSQPLTGYSDNTDTVFDLSRLLSNSVTLTPGYSSYNYTTYWRAFIDWNKDGSFTTDEYAFSGSGNAAINGSIAVPESALGGITRMRVSMQYASYPGACSNLSYGEVEDFRVNIPEPAPDTTAPSVNSVNPLNGEQDVLVNSVITINFSEEIDPATINSTSLVLSSSAAPVVLDLNYDPATQQAVFTPTQALANETFYTATLLSGVSDLAGNAMINDYNWEFSTEIDQGETFVVSGSVQDTFGGLADVAINVSGDAWLDTTTDLNGNYSLDPLPAGNYTLTPSKTGYVFTPTSMGITVVDANVSAVNFTANVINNALENGDFEYGTFNGFTSFTTSSGSVSKAIVTTDVNNDGETSLAARFSVGIDNAGAVGTSQGGGIHQTINLNDGDLALTMDIAAYAYSNNGDGGTVEVLFDGQVMDSHSFGSITAGVKEIATLSFTLPNVTAGSHEVRIRVTRQYMPTSIYNYVDDIVVTGSSAQ